MPIYEYQCAACSHKLERLQKVAEPPLSDCPACGKAALSKLVSAAAFRLKGSGWYETDFKTGGKKHGTGAEPGADGKDAAGDKNGGKDAGGADKEPGKGSDAASASSKEASGTTKESRGSSASKESSPAPSSKRDAAAS